jgi:hypothetical protein
MTPRSPAPSVLSNAYVVPVARRVPELVVAIACSLTIVSITQFCQFQTSSRAVEAGTTRNSPTRSCEESGGADRIETAKRAAASCREEGCGVVQTRFR